MTKVKIIGAGSIGNHLSQAARQKGWDVTLCDSDPAALQRTKEDIYPGRYGAWDHNIAVCLSEDAPTGSFDYIFIGTPPDSHMALARQAVTENPRGILVEKPFCTPDLNGARSLWEEANAAGVRVFTGYDHVVARSIGKARELLDAHIGTPLTLDVSFREHWAGIFRAHPWLDGPGDTYLGYWKRGGGACAEHSHALNLWQHFAQSLHMGRVTDVTANLEYVNDGKIDYDSMAFLTLRTERGLLGRVCQDVVTRPTQKLARITGDKSTVEWMADTGAGQDEVSVTGDVHETHPFPKSRPDDFIQELDHIEAVMETGGPSSISMERGLDSMLVIAAAHLSARQRKTVSIDYSKGYTPDALMMTG